MSEAAADGGFGPVAGPLRLLSDERLVQRASGGDERALAAIYRRYHQGLYRFCLAILGDPQDAQDALQSTMVKVVRALPGERRQIQLKPWLYRIAHNESIEVLRRRAPTEQLEPDSAVATAGPAERVEQRARLRRLVADIEQLPDRQRGALVMRELAGLSFEEIGTALGTSPAVARQTLYEARLSLRQMEEGRELSCDLVTRALSDGDGRVTRRRDIRAHLRECSSCCEFRDELRRRSGDFAALAPLPAAVAAGILQGIAGAGGAGSGGAAAGAAGSAAAGKALGGAALGTSTLVKSTATVAVVAAIGVGAADRGGLIDAGLPGGSSPGASAATEAADGPPATVEGGGSAGSKEAPPGEGEDAAARHPSEGSRKGDRQEDREVVPAVDPKAGNNGAASPTSSTEATAPGSSASHRNDDGARGKPPAAAAHGQETAASHKGGAAAKGGGPYEKGASGGRKSSGNKGGRGLGKENGGGKSKAQTAEPVKPDPPKPEHPSKSNEESPGLP